jgi:hypothetical protein
MAPDEELEVSYTSEGIIVTLHSEGEVAQHPVESQQVDGQLRLEGL